MNFLHAPWLFALLGIAVPIVLHLQRKRTRTLDWAAMRFLQKSLIHRRRGLTLEQLALLACRCLLLATFVLAIANPWSPYPYQASSLVAIALTAIAIIALAWAVVSNAQPWFRLLAGIAAFTTIGLAVMIAWSTDQTLQTTWDSPRDVVFIIDGSDSMGLRPTDKENLPSYDEVDTSPKKTLSHFKRALLEAESILEKLPNESTVAVLVTGGVSRQTNVHLQKNLQAARDQMRSSKPTTGQSNLPVAIDQAKAILKRGKNAKQQIVVFTDDQSTNWQSLQDHASPGDSSTTDVRLIGRVFNLPDGRLNLAVTRLEIDDRSLRTGEKLSLRIEVLNGGTHLVQTATCDILLNDVVVETKSLNRLEPGLSHILAAEIPLAKPGAHIVSARVNLADDIAGDNRFDRAFAVLPPMTVLVVDGSTTPSRSRRTATYVGLALGGRAINAETIAAAQLSQVDDLHRYETVILCDVPWLNETVAQKLGQYVASGGGLMLLIGRQCETDFYNQWQFENKRVMPLPLINFASQPLVDNESYSVDVTSITHKPLLKLVESGEHDFTQWTATNFWKLGQQDDSAASVTVRFNSGDPLLVVQSIGRGRVLVQTTSPEPSQNNFINRVSFPVWMHLLTRDLADGELTRLHQKQSLQWTVDLPTESSSDTTKDANEPHTFELKTAGDDPRQAIGTKIDDRWAVELGSGNMPGRYELSGRVETKLGPSPWPLTIERFAGEADLSAAKPQELNSLAQQIGLKLVNDKFEMHSFASGAPEVIRWWRHFAFTALLLVAVESILLMWVRSRRTERLDATSEVSWGNRLVVPLWIAIAWAGFWSVWTQVWQLAGQITQATLDQPSTWIAPLAATLCCVVAWTYSSDRWPARFTLPTLMKASRMLLIGLLGFILLEPSYSGEDETTQRRQVIVLWDRSDSMHLPISNALGKLGQPINQPDASVGNASSVISRDSVAKDLLWAGFQNQAALMADLKSNFDVLLYEFETSPRLLSDESRLVDPFGSPWSKTTDLAAALQGTLTNVPLNEISGVIILTDGCDHSTASHNPSVVGLSRQNIPVHSIVLGDQSLIKDIGVATIQTASQVFVGDQVTVRATIKADQLVGYAAHVKFLRDGEVLKTQLLQIPNDHYRTTVEFQDDPPKTAFHQYGIEVERLGDESNVLNNRALASVKVTSDRLRLLLIEQRPRWEFRYLKNLFAGRDRNVSLQHALLSPDRLAGVPDPFPIAASASRAFDDCEANQLPESEQDWLKFDVIVLGDVDPDELDESTLQTLDKFVRVRGGTLIVIAGQQAMPHRYLDTPLANLLPVQRSTSQAKSVESGYRIQLTDDGDRSPMLQNPYNDQNALSVWKTLPRLHWRHPMAIAKPGATVLAWADESTNPPNLNTVDQEDVAIRARQQALILWHRFGGGRVLQMNFDQTWRLRFWNGDKHHHDFWGRVVRWATEDRLGMGTELVRLGIDKIDCAPGDDLNVKVRLVDDQVENANKTDASLSLYRDDVLVEEFELQEVVDTGGLLHAQITAPDQPGRYRVQVNGATVDKLLKIENLENQNVFAEFTVAASAIQGESQDIVASLAAVTPLANMTRGRVVGPENAQQILEHLGPKSIYRRDRWTVPLWNSWPLVSLFFFLLGGEWMTRRWCGLI